MRYAEHHIMGMIAKFTSREERKRINEENGSRQVRAARERLAPSGTPNLFRRFTITQNKRQQ